MLSSAPRPNYKQKGFYLHRLQRKRPLPISRRFQGHGLVVMPMETRPGLSPIQNGRGNTYKLDNFNGLWDLMGQSNYWFVLATN
jgi:hypothetical protein